MVTRVENGQSINYHTVAYAGTDPLYIGNVAADGSWVIEKFSAAAKTLLYCVGKSDYATNWTARATLTYALPNEV
jgi:hypothetical protein